MRLSDVQRVYGSGVTEAGGASNLKLNDFRCANAPTVQFADTFFPGHSKGGLLNITASLTQYKSSAGPRCNFGSDISQRKTLGPGDGIVTKLNGVGNQAALVRLDPGKGAKGPPVYALEARFIRDRYLVVIAVQMNRKVRPTDVTRLAQAVDSRIKKGG
jgi:hypothetical protein